MDNGRGRVMNTVQILNFEEKYKEDLKRLSYEWLEKYVSVEPEDEKILNNPQGVVIDRGGYIFFAKCVEEIVGTVSLIRINENAFELAKLAVTERFQGSGIGNKLMSHCLNVAKQNGAKEVILFTNHVLTAAIRLYEKFNFEKIPLENNKYIEADLKMKLQLYGDE